MMQDFKTRSELYFLSGGGEMGELIRLKNWSNTSLGDPAHWPHSLRTIVSIMLENPFGMYIAWGNDFIQLYNDGYRPILGSTKHPAALGISTRITFEEIWHIIGPMFDGVMKGKAVGFPDFMLPLNRNNFVEECYFDFSYSPIRKENGQVGGILVTVIETTNKKKAEDALKESELRFRTLADNIPNLAWMADADGGIFWYNKKWYDYTGTGPEQMKGWGWQSVHDPRELPAVLKKWQASIESGEPFEMVFPIRGYDGVFREFLTRVLPMYDDKGKIYQWFGTNTDISDQKKSEKALWEKEQNLRKTILQAPVAMCIFKGPTHIVELANDRMFELWGRSAEELQNRPIFDGLPEAKNQGFEALLDGVYTTGKSFSAEGVPITLPRSKSIEIAYVNFVYEAYREADGTISGILAVAVDVTAQIIARQKIEEVVTERTQELEAVNINLQKSNAELAQFAYIASHDLQEPLRKISTYSQLMKKSLKENADEESINYLTKINDSSFRMTQLIRGVLSYSELLNKKDEFIEVNLNQILENIRTDYDLLIAQTEASVISSVLPVVEAIPVQMSQLFGNLIGNSLKFIRKDLKPEITITSKKLSKEELNGYSLEKDTDYYKIQFNDNGIGFEEKYADQIFDIFKRLHGKSEYTGTGIGLALCKKIVVNHKGIINAIGSSGSGAVFNVILPGKRTPAK